MFSYISCHLLPDKGEADLEAAFALRVSALRSDMKPLRSISLLL